ncbi:MAG: hypothetical protein OXI63_15265 [Candidatus Poribacteria bacterium]|nr:hypothetical protein [Candidatus Poribacteria bacterium]
MDLTLAIILISLFGGLSVFLFLRWSLLNSENAHLTRRLGTSNQENEQLSNDLKQSNEEREHLSEVLEQERQLNERLSNELEQERQLSERLSNELEQERQLSERLSNELEQERQLNERLSNELEQERQLNERLSENLKEVVESNKNALWLICLSELSLHLCLAVIYDEQRRFNHLLEVYKELVAKVERATNRRRLRMGLKALLAFVPLGSLLDLLGDGLEMMAEAIDDIGEVAEEVDNSVELEGSMEIEDDVIKLPASLSRAKDLLGLLSEQSEEPDVKELDLTRLRNSVNPLIQRIKEFIESLTGDQRQEVIARIIANFEEFGIKDYRYDETTKTLQENLPHSE